MGKLIVDNRTSFSDYEMLQLVMNIISEGRVSNNEKQYCYLTAWIYDGKGIYVASRLNKKSDGFVITEREINEH